MQSSEQQQNTYQQQGNSGKHQNRIRYADKETRVESLGKLCNLTQKCMSDRKLKQGDAVIQIENRSGPFVIFNYPNISIVQSHTDCVCILDCNPYNDLIKQNHHTIIFQENQQYNALVITEFGTVMYFVNLNLVKNQQIVQQPVDGCQIDYFKDEFTGHCIYNQNLTITTSHGRVCRILLENNQLNQVHQNFTLDKNQKNARRDISTTTFQERHQGQSEVKKINIKNITNYFKQSNDEYVDIAEAKLNNSFIQNFEFINKPVHGDKDEIIAVKELNNVTYCLKHDCLVTFTSNKLKTAAIINFDSLKNSEFEFLSLSSAISTFKNNKQINQKHTIYSKYQLVLRDFEIASEHEVVLLANLINQNVTNQYFNLVIIKYNILNKSVLINNIVIKKQLNNQNQSQLIMENQANQDNLLKDKHNDVNKQLKVQLQLFNEPYYFQMDLIGQEHQLLMSNYKTSQLNIIFFNQVIKVNISSLYEKKIVQQQNSQGFIVQNNNFQQYLNQLFEKDTLHIQSQLNQIPDQIRKILCYCYQHQLQKKYLQYIDKDYINKQSSQHFLPGKILSSVVNKIFGSCQNIQINNIICSIIKLQQTKNADNTQTMTTTTKYQEKSRFNQPNQTIYGACFCQLSLTKQIQKFHTNTIFLLLDNEILFVQQFNKHVFLDIIQKTNSGKFSTLENNFTSYLRNEELYNQQPFGLETNKEVEKLLLQISNRTINDLKVDYQWFQVLNKGVISEQTVENHMQVLKSFIEGGLQKQQELLYFIHFLKETDYYQLLEENTRQQFMHSFDAINGSICLIQYILDLLQQQDMQNIDLVRKLEEQLISKLTDGMLKQGKIEKLSNLECLLSKVYIQTEYQYIQSCLLQNNGNSIFVEMFANYIDNIIKKKLCYSDVFDFSFKKQFKDNSQKVINIEQLKQFFSNQRLIQSCQLSTICKLYNALFFFDYQNCQHQELQQLQTYAKSQPFCTDIVEVFVRYHFYQEAIEYCISKLNINTEIIKRDKNNILVHSTELQQQDYNITDRLAFYYQQHQQMMSQQTEKPSFLEVENYRYELFKNNNKLDMIQTILPENLLNLFKQAQMEEDVFSDLGSTALFGEILKQFGLIWWEV